MPQLEEHLGKFDVEVAEKFDPTSYYEQAAGRLVIDPQLAKVEFGEALASMLKLSPDGSTILWPQPANDPNDPQNWSDRRKALHLLVITLAASIPDFDSGIGIASIFGLAQTYHTTTGVINNLTSNWSIFLLGWGGIFWVILMRRYGRLPVLFWTQIFALAFLVGATFSPDLATFTGHGLYVITDIFPFHLQAKKLNIWTLGFIMHVFNDWRWAYGIGSLYSAVIVLLIGLFLEETMYDRHMDHNPQRILPGIQYRLETLIGITGYKMAKYRSHWSEVVWACLNVVWRPQFILVVCFEAFVFGFAVGINVTNVVFMGSPPPVGFGFSQFGVAGAYATPILAVILGELGGRFLNERIMNFTVRKNKGIFEAESRLWACYAAMPLFICGFLTLGAGIQHLNKAAFIIGWGIAEIAVMMNTVAVYAYCSDCFPRHQGEISALLNLARVLGGFSVAYFQVPWATKSGGIQTFGVEAAIVIGLFLIAVPTVQLRGRYFRVRDNIIII
ncbi:major facilitator superfamily domain-containing protein [Suillus plorans]|uniref:Major facilitator superfamily domain-containing protein n=1 Tax=Suillus plorans TaxID=116603 RepID=A0A9P7APH2_9AGAM|nr:major facilitator superfamily domain-containing protein [Suillus plorans]KAG1793688.1 major facilitator superfamily domain-containing protein [Suillus plorans]